MGLFSGKKGLVLGVANDFSIAWAITLKLLAEGAEVGFTHLPGEKMERRVRKLAEPIGAKMIISCDVQKDDDVARVVRPGERNLRRLDFVLHSIAFAPIDDLKVPVRGGQPRGLQDGHGHQRLFAGDRGPARRPCHPRGRSDPDVDLFRR